MKNESIGVMRGIFDPVHKGHINAMLSSMKTLNLSKLIVIAKYIGEKEPKASIHERIRMIKMALNNYDFPNEVIVREQNIKGHLVELLTIKEDFGLNPVNICGTDKIIRELNIYGKSGDTFGVTVRENVNLINVTLVAKNKGINLNFIEYPFSFESSTNVRNALNKNINDYTGVDQNVLDYIYLNRLYGTGIQHIDSHHKFILYRQTFINQINKKFPDLLLQTLEIPHFDKKQSIDSWNEKFIRYIIRHFNLDGDNLLKFVIEAQKINNNNILS